MKKVFTVEVRGQQAVYTFDTKAEAKDYAITATAWSGGQYRITTTIVATEAKA